MNPTNNLVNIAPVQIKELEKKIIKLAQDVQSGEIKNHEVPSFIDNLMSNRQLTRELLVTTLESYNDTLPTTNKNWDNGLESATRFWLIDAYDTWMTIKARQETNQNRVNEIITE